MNAFIHGLVSVRMTIISSVFLLGSFIFWIRDISPALDPAWVSILISGTPIAWGAWESLYHRHKITSALLITLGIIASAAIGEIFAAGEIAVIMSFGEMLEDWTVSRARKGITKLFSLAPRQGRRVSQEAGIEVEKIIPAQEILKGDILRILPGEAIPVDGEIVSGSTSVDQSVMTGESLPVDKAAGDSVFSGTINRFGAIDIRATRVGEDSSLQRLIRMVRDAEENKAPLQRIVDRWASWIVPSALVIAVLTWIFTNDITRAVTVLVVFCPCALALATPTTIAAAIGQATRYGVLVKSGSALEVMGKVDCVAFDKTGTLTHGSLTVSDCLPLPDGYSAGELLRTAASVEALSEHPLGKAVAAHARAGGHQPLPVEAFTMLPGLGVSAVYNGRTIRCGNERFLGAHGVELSDRAHEILKGLREQGKATILVAEDKVCTGVIALADSLRQGSADSIRQLHSMGAHTVLLTGDHEHAAQYFARTSGVRKVHAGLLPAQKVEIVSGLQQQGRCVCMIGDGVNDAPALKTANVGIAMGAMGSDIAIEAADIALMGDDIGKISYLKRLSIAASRTITANIILSMGINFIAILLSVTGVLTPVLGALVHNASSVIVVLNAALLYDRSFDGSSTPPSRPRKGCCSTC